MTMSAFAAPVALSSRTRKNAVIQRAGTTRMCARTPGDESAAPSKYSQYISASRLNKAPVITLNTFPDESYNNISVSLVDLHTDLGAAATLRAIEDARGPREAGPDPALYAQYYDPATANRAPFITIFGSSKGKDFDKRAVSVAMLEAPLQVNLPQGILDQSFVVDPSKRIMKGPPVAPEIILSDKKDENEENVVYVNFPVQHLNFVAAQVILDSFRK